METKCIAEVCEIISGGTPKTSVPEYWNGNIGWLSVKDFGGGKKYVYESEKTITELGVYKSSTNILKEDDIILSARGTVGEMAMIGTPMAFNQSCFGLRTKNNNILDQEYLFYALKNSIKSITSVTQGSVFETINRASFERIFISYADIKNQRKVATFLADIDSKIENNEQINRNLLEQAEILFQSWFVDYEHFGGCCPEDWTEGVLEDVVDFFNGYAFKSSELLDAPDSNNECYHVFKQGHINRGGGFNISGTKSWFPKKDSEKLSRYVLRKGDILMAMTDMKNNVAILGNTAVMEMDDTYILNQRVALLRANGTFGIEYPFVYLLTNSIDFISDLRSRANSGVQVNLSATEIKNSKLMIPSTEVNKEFNSLVHPLFEAMIEHDLENLRLGELRDALLPKFMSGELDLSDVDL